MQQTINTYSRPVRLQTVKLFDKILLLRKGRDGKLRYYEGTVQAFKQFRNRTITIRVENRWEDGVKVTPSKSERIGREFRVDKCVSLFLDPSAVSSGNTARSKLAQERIAYAKARASLRLARDNSNKNFKLLGLSQSSSKEEFRKVRREMFLKWHPDKQSASNLSEEDFAVKSKEITDALSYVSKFFN